MDHSGSKLEVLRPKIIAKLQDYPDFPIKGILFRDIMPLFSDAQLIQDLCTAIYEHAAALSQPIGAVAGLEARGFLFGPQVACHLGVPFVPIRKKGKLPGETVRASYIKEYGEDIIEIQKNALPPGTNVFIIDDLLATGGTMCAAIDLIHKAESKVTEAFCLIELSDLKGRDVLPKNTTFYSLIQF